MKTHDMAKENNFVLREAAKAACDGYYTHLQNGGKGDPAEERWIEALTAGSDAITQVAVLESRLAQAERENEALMHDVSKCRRCETCAKRRIPIHKCPHFDGGTQYPCWQWRGVCPENTKEENG